MHTALKTVENVWNVNLMTVNLLLELLMQGSIKNEKQMYYLPVFHHSSSRFPEHKSPRRLVPSWVKGSYSWVHQRIPVLNLLSQMERLSGKFYILFYWQFVWFKVLIKCRQPVKKLATSSFEPPTFRGTREGWQWFQAFTFALLHPSHLLQTLLRTLMV